MSSRMGKVRTEPGGTIIERDTPVHLLFTRRDIGVARVTTARPPAACLGVRRGIGAASAGTVSRGNVGDVEAVDERDVVPIRVAVAAERPLSDGGGRDTRAGVLGALEAAVAATGLAGGRARVGAEVAVAATLCDNRWSAVDPRRHGCRDVPRYDQPASCWEQKS